VETAAKSVDVLFDSLQKKEDVAKSVVKCFRALFSGNPNGFYFHGPGAFGGRDYCAKRGNPTDNQIIDHLTGRGYGLLSVPIRPADNTVRFGTIDVDRHKESDPVVDHAALEAEITRLGVPLVMTRSKRNGAHLWLFFKEKEGIPAADAIRILTDYAEQLGLNKDKKVEIFPKQTKAGPYGSGINLPYHGMERWGVGPGGEPIELIDFFELATRKRAYGSILLRDLNRVSNQPAIATADSPKPKADEFKWKPMLARTAQRMHAENLSALRTATRDSRWKRLYAASAFAAQASAANAIETDAQSEIWKALCDKYKSVSDSYKPDDRYSRTDVRPEIWNALCDQFKSVGQHHDPDSRYVKTLDEAWENGLKEPLEIKEENEGDRVVAGLNEKYFVIKNYGNRCRVAWFEEEEHPELKGRIKLGHQSFMEFRNAELNKLVPYKDENGETKYMPRGEYWLRDANRREYWRVVFMPGQKVRPELLNLWQGFAFEPKKGDCHLYLEHLQKIICSSNYEHYDYTLKWMARGVQGPWERGHVALVWRGDKGPGKNLAADAYARLFGPHSMTITNSEHLVGRFNSHLRGKCVLIANEAFYAGNKQHEATLKGLVTDSTLPIEQKFVDAETDVNLLHLIVISNNEWVVPATEKERRYFMVDVSSERIGDFNYFAKLQEELDNGGHAALLYHLLNEVDIRDFNVRDVPKTAVLRSQMRQSLSGIDAVWYECLVRGEIPGIVGDGLWLRATDLVDWAANQKRHDWIGISAEKAGHLLGKNPRSDRGMDFPKGRPNLLDKETRAFQIPDLASARERWNEKRFEGDWDKEDTDWRIISVLRKTAA
jgi:Family of unknown function (DUF5906)